MDRVSILIDKIEEVRKNKKGIAFYSISEGTYVFIETTEEQRFKIKCAIHLDPVQEYIDVLNM